MNYSTYLYDQCNVRMCVMCHGLGFQERYNTMQVRPFCPATYRLPYQDISREKFPGVKLLLFFLILIFESV